MQQHAASPLTDYIEYTPADMLERSEHFYTEIKRRHSIRQFSERAVSRQVIENCIRAVGTAPKGANHQPWHFVAIQSPEVKLQIRQQAEQHEQGFYAGRAGEERVRGFKTFRYRCRQALFAACALVNRYFQSKNQWA
jgi:iodotyrosine deiodinase